jgi:hypothetical protein
MFELRLLPVTKQVSFGNVLVVLFMLFPPELTAINAPDRPALTSLVGFVRFIIP